MITQRQELLHTCLQDLLTLNPQGPTLSPLLAFLDPSFITCPLDTPVNSTPFQQASASAQPPTQDNISASSEKHGSRMRLLTDAPVRFTDKELMLRQQGQCAECGKALPAVGTSWLGRTSSKAGSQCACIIHFILCLTVWGVEPVAFIVHASQHCFLCACITTLLSVCMHHNIAFSVHASQRCFQCACIATLLDGHQGINQSINHSINQFTFLVLKTHQGSPQYK